MPIPIPQPKTLQETVMRLQAWFPLNDRPQTTEEKAVSGYNVFRKEILPIHYQAVDEEGNIIRESKSIEVAINTPRKNDKTQWENRQAATIRLRKMLNLDEKNENFSQQPDKQSTLFIQNLLFQGKVGKVAICANADLVAWFTNDYPVLNEEQLKEFVAQLLMGINTFHSNDSVHRDIKPNNIVVYQRENDFYFEIIDTDTTAEVNTKNSGFTWSRDFLPPESREHSSTVTKLDQQKYPSLNKRTIDCYAMGRTLQTMLASLPCVLLASRTDHTALEKSLIEKAIKEKRALILRCEAKATLHIYGDTTGNNNWQWSEVERDILHTLPFERGIISHNDNKADSILLEALTDVANTYHKQPHIKTIYDLLTISYHLQLVEPAKRSSITDVMQQSCFGETPLARKNYFDSIRKKHRRPDEYFDSWYRNANDFYTVDNAFFIQVKTLKIIHLHAIFLLNQTQHLQTLFQQANSNAKRNTMMN